jgi:hypothetical protein
MGDRHCPARLATVWVARTSGERRDRKELVGNPLSLASNLVFACGLSTGMWTRVSPAMARVAILTLALQLVRIAIRMAVTCTELGSGSACLFALSTRIL